MKIKQIMLLLLMTTCFFVPRSAFGNIVDIKIDPRATYLRTYSDQSPNSIAINLFNLGFQGGELVTLTPVGDWMQSPDMRGETRSDMIGVFSNSNILLSSSTSDRVPGAIDAGVDYVTKKTFFGMMPTDIPEDFLVENTLIQIPNQAEFLFVASNDDYFTDNSDPNNNFYLRIASASNSVVPEPASVFLLATGICGLCGMRKRYINF